MTNEQRGIFVVSPLLNGEFAVVINCIDANPHDSQSKYTIIRFASEQDAERWGKERRTGAA
jgi:hypothetical protein